MTDTATATTTAEEQLAVFRQRRDLAVVQPKGNLALVNTQWVDSEQAIYGVPGVWAPLPAGQSGLRVTASAADGIRVDGELVDGSAIVAGKDSDEARRDHVQRHGERFRHRRRSGNYALRVWDANSEAIQNFGTHRRLRVQPGVGGAGEVHRAAGSDHFRSSTARTRARPANSRCRARSRSARTASTTAWPRSSRAVRCRSCSPMRPAASSTYSVGRFLFVAPDADGNVTLDFNRAVLPPCSFSYAFNCPMPPKQNRFAVAIEAGEKNVLAKDGTLLH